MSKKVKDGFAAKKVTIGMLSLGCPKNLVDSEVMLGKLKSRGYRIAGGVTDCTVAVINTCAFIQEARQESVDSILEIVELKKEGRIRGIIVTGCLSQKYYRELGDGIREIDAFLGTDGYPGIDKIVSKILRGERVVSVEDTRFVYDRALPRYSLTPAHYKYIKIAEGCDHRCSFCIIPELRGDYRSRSVNSVVEEIEGLCALGMKEADLVSQDSSYYGHDLGGEFLLSELLWRLERIEGLRWIRLLYNHPAHMTDELLETIAGTVKVCKYIDLPLQHISDTILKSMKRGIDRKKTLALLAKIRRIPGLALRTALIVGYPGETENEFRELYEFVKEAEFERLGVFLYSRGDDEASGLEGQVPLKVREERKHLLMMLQQEIAFRKNALLVGRTLEVLADGKDPGTQEWVGRTYADAPEVDGRVYLETSRKEIRAGEFYPVKITGTRDYDLTGEIK